MKIKKHELTRDILENFAGKKVKIVFFDNTTCEGVLRLGNGFFYEPKKYTVDHFCFRLSHIKTLEVKEI